MSSLQCLHKMSKVHEQALTGMQLHKTNTICVNVHFQEYMWTWHRKWHIRKNREVKKPHSLSDHNTPSHPSPFVCLLLGMSCISQAVLLCVNEGFTPLEALTDPPLIFALHWKHHWFHIGPIWCLAVLCMWGDSSVFHYCLWKTLFSLKSVLFNKNAIFYVLVEVHVFIHLQFCEF